MRVPKTLLTPEPNMQAIFNRYVKFNKPCPSLGYPVRECQMILGVIVITVTFMDHQFVNILLTTQTSSPIC